MHNKYCATSSYHAKHHTENWNMYKNGTYNIQDTNTLVTVIWHFIIHMYICWYFRYTTSWYQNVFSLPIWGITLSVFLKLVLQDLLYVEYVSHKIQGSLACTETKCPNSLRTKTLCPIESWFLWNIREWHISQWEAVYYKLKTNRQYAWWYIMNNLFKLWCKFNFLWTSGAAIHKNWVRNATCRRDVNPQTLRVIIKHMTVSAKMTSTTWLMMHVFSPNYIMLTGCTSLLLISWLHMLGFPHLSQKVDNLSG